MNIDSLGPKRNRRHFAGDVFKYIFLKENVLILIEISFELIPKGPIDNIQALVHLLAWCRIYMRHSASMS